MLINSKATEGRISQDLPAATKMAIIASTFILAATVVNGLCSLTGKDSVYIAKPEVVLQVNYSALTFVILS